MEIIIGRQGNQKKTITEPTVSRKHCKVMRNADGTYTVENLSDLGTKVNGANIIRTSATLDSLLELGPNFKVTLRELIGEPKTARTSSERQEVPRVSKHPQISNQPKTELKTYNISHLRYVWEDYNKKNVEFLEKQRKINLTRTGLGIFTMCAMPTLFFLGPIGYVLTGIGVLGNIYSFVGMKNSESVLERQKRQETFEDAWICPNPECRKSLPAKDYRYLVRNHQYCPYCKCKYVEK